MLKELGKENTIKLLSTFSCPKNSDVEKFLHSTSIRFEESDNARTYLMLSDETSEIMAYFSISFKELSLENAKISKGEVKRLDGINKHAEKLKVYLIGQIAKNFNIDNNTVQLDDILSASYAVINDAKALIGGRAIILECENNQKLIALYEQHEFKKLNITNDADSLITMYTYIQ